MLQGKEYKNLFLLYEKFQVENFIVGMKNRQVSNGIWTWLGFRTSLKAYLGLDKVQHLNYFREKVEALAFITHRDQAPYV